MTKNADQKQRYEFRKEFNTKKALAKPQAFFLPAFCSRAAKRAWALIVGSAFNGKAIKHAVAFSC